MASHEQHMAVLEVLLADKAAEYETAMRQNDAGAPSRKRLLADQRFALAYALGYIEGARGRTEVPKP